MSLGRRAPLLSPLTIYRGRLDVRRMWYPRVVDDTDDSAVSRGNSSCSPMTPLRSLKLPLDLSFGEIQRVDIHCRWQQKLQERALDHSCSCSSSLVEGGSFDEGEGGGVSCMAVEASSCHFAYSDGTDGFLCDVSSPSSSSSSSYFCETPKGGSIVSPSQPPSPPRKRKAVSSGKVQPDGTLSFFYPPDDFELLFRPLASAMN